MASTFLDLRNQLNTAIKNNDVNTVQGLMKDPNMNKAGTSGLLQKAQGYMSSYSPAVDKQTNVTAPIGNTGAIKTGNVSTGTIGNTQGGTVGAGASIGSGVTGGNTTTTGGTQATSNDQIPTGNQTIQGGSQTIGGGQTVQSTIPQDALKTVSDQLGYTSTFDQNTGMVTIQNNYTGKTVSFANGEGQEFGMGGNTNGYNVVKDANALKSALGSANPMDYERSEIPKEVKTEDQVIETPEEVDLTKQAMDEFGIEDMKLELPDYSEQINTLISGLKDYNLKFSAARDEMLSTLRSTFGNPFQYDPNTDPALQSAMKYAENQVMEEANARGILNSTITADDMRTAYAEMVPKYQELAFQKYNENIKNQLQYADFMQRIDENDYKRYADFVTSSLDVIKSTRTDELEVAKANITSMWNRVEDLQKKEDRKITAKESAIKSAIERLKTFGYVMTNEDAIALAVPVGTPSDEVLARAENFENDITKIKFTNSLKMDELKETHKNAIERIDYEIEKKNEVSQRESEAKASVGNIKAQLYQMTPSQAIAVLADKSDEILGSDIAKYAGDDFNKLVGDVYKYFTDERDYGLDSAKFSLSQWEAMDQSQRGWAGNKISEKNYNERVRENDMKENDNKVDKTYVSGVKSQVKKIMSDFENELKNSGGILDDDKSGYLKVEGSAEKKQMFDRATAYLAETDLEGDDVVKALNENGFTKNEINKWLKKKQ